MLQVSAEDDATTFCWLEAECMDIGCSFVATLTRRIQASAVFVMKPVVHVLVVPERRMIVKPVPVDIERMCVGPFHISPVAVHVSITVRPSSALPLARGCGPHGVVSRKVAWSSVASPTYWTAAGDSPLYMDGSNAIPSPPPSFVRNTMIVRSSFPVTREIHARLDRASCPTT